MTIEQRHQRRCVFEAVHHFCTEEFVNADRLCAQHANLLCLNCGAKATRGCVHIVRTYPRIYDCGKPACDECRHCYPAHGAPQPPPKCSGNCELCCAERPKA